MAMHLWFFASMKYLAYIVIGSSVPVILASQRGPAGLGSRYAIAAGAGILGGTFAAWLSRLKGFWGQGGDYSSTFAIMEMSDALTAFALAAALGTFLYIMADALLAGTLKSRTGRGGKPTASA